MFLSFNNYYRMQQLRKQNIRLKSLRSSYEQQLQKLKQVGRTHQNEIDTLLKFNERLLGIIENEFSASAQNKINSDLQIISETNEVADNFASENKLKSKLQPGDKRFEDQQMVGFEEEEEDQEEIYNQDKQATAPVQQQTQGISTELDKRAKMERVLQLQHKDESDLISFLMAAKAQTTDGEIKPQTKQAAAPLGPVSAELEQLKEMIKEYKQQFVDNAEQYEQICTIIHSDLMSDLSQFRKIEEQSRGFYNSKMQEVRNLRGEMGAFNPVGELLKVMKKLKVPQKTERLLQQRIINKHTRQI